jgi:predicted kinase
MKTLYIVRGVSGSGKTTYAKKLTERVGCYYFEADHFFEDAEGVYTFDGSKLKDAHLWCFEGVSGEIDRGYDVIVANTFTRTWEMRQYIYTALAHDYHIVIVECTGRYQNVHGLDEAAVARQVARFQGADEIRKQYPDLIYSGRISLVEI